MNRFDRLLRTLRGQNAYEILNVSDSASDAEIKEAYRILARTRHPDITGGTDTAAMTLVNVAHEMLRDLRTEYDSHLAESHADTDGADRIRTGQPESGLWDDPFDWAEEPGETAAEPPDYAEYDAEPEPSLWDEPDEHHQQHTWQSSNPAAGGYPGWMPGHQPGGHGRGHPTYGYPDPRYPVSGYPAHGYPVHGYPQSGQWPTRYAWQTSWHSYTAAPPVHSYLWLAIIVTFVFAPCGIVALVKSSEVGSRCLRGDFLGAQRAARLSVIWSLLGFLPLVLLIFAVVLAPST